MVTCADAVTANNNRQKVTARKQVRKKVRLRSRGSDRFIFLPVGHSDAFRSWRVCPGRGDSPNRPRMVAPESAIMSECLSKESTSFYRKGNAKFLNNSNQESRNPGGNFRF